MTKKGITLVQQEAGLPTGKTTKINKHSQCRWLIRTLITGLFLIILFHQVPWQEVWPVWKGLPARAWLSALALTFLAIVLSAYKWRLILDEPGETAPGTGRLLVIYLIGLFFNNFMPSAIGGDVVRAALVGKSLGAPQAAASVLAERLLAAVGLVLPSLVFFFPYREKLGSATAVVPVLTAAVVLLTTACLFPSWARREVLIFQRWPQVFQGLTRFLDTMARYRHRPVMIFQVIIWSVLFQGVVIIINYVLFRGMGLPVSFASCIVLVPLISALAMIPVSINGLGIREWGYVTLFTPLGVDAAASVAVSLTFFLVVMLVSVAGGVLYVLER